MGYTHYFKQSKPFTTEQWTIITKEAKRVIRASNIPLGDAMGENKPIVNDEQISLNGKDDDGHESFIIAKEPISDFYFLFKTARKPYDSVVVSILAKAQEVAPDAINVNSDGGKEAIKNMFPSTKVKKPAMKTIELNGVEVTIATDKEGRMYVRIETGELEQAETEFGPNINIGLNDAWLYRADEGVIL